MSNESTVHLASIRKGIWTLVALLLVLLGYDHTGFGKSEPGEALAIIGLITGILMIIFTVVAGGIRWLVALKKRADLESGN